jgi:DNA-binding NtrC family response regulator
MNYPNKARILVVNSDELVAKFTSNLLTNYGYKVKTANNGLTVVELFNQSPNDYDLLIMEQSMSSLSGMELACRIREIQPTIPIILETNEKIHEDAKKPILIDRCRYVSNPMQANSLLKLAAEMLQSGA